VLQRDRGRPQEALDNFDEARKIPEALTARHPGEPRFQAELAATQQNLSRLLADNGETDEARQNYEKARDILVRLEKSHPNVTEYRGKLASTLIHLGRLVQIDKAQQAQKYFERALDLSERLVVEQADVEHQADLANACNALGQMVRPEDPEDAQRLHRQAVKILQRLAGQHPEEPGYRIDLAGACYNLAHALRDGGDPEGALPWYDRAIKEIARLKDRGSSAEARAVLSAAHWGRAEALGKLGRHRDSLPDFEKALALSEPENHHLIQLDRAFALAKAGQHGEAMTDVDSLLKGKGVGGRTLFNLACVTALAARALARDEARPLAVRAREADRLAVRAVELLERAHLAGLFRDADPRKNLENDTDLDYLRDRDDFKRFVRQVQSTPPRPR
jgi:tetratricopeptide (TPR) repeat protein